MYYKYNEEELRYENKIVMLGFIIIIGLVVALLIGFTIGYYTGKYQPIETLSAKEKVIVINTMDPFKTDSLKQNYAEDPNYFNKLLKILNNG